LVVGAYIDTSARHNAGGVVGMHRCHLFVCSAPGENNSTGVPVVTVKLLVAGIAGANRPHDHVIRAISRGDKGGADPPLGHIPNFSNRRWIPWIDAKRRKRVAAPAESNTGPLVSPVAGRSLDDCVVVNVRKSYRRADTPEVIAIKQIRIAILSQCDDQTGGRCTGHIHQQWTRTAQVGVAQIE
jgi:hypothetical protein